MSMFGALNRFISRLDSEPQARDIGATNRTAAGFQVLRNVNTELAIEPWFDFIIGINGRNIESSDPTLFATEVKNCAGAAVNLGVWSAKGQRVRSLYCPVPAESSTLGLSLQWNYLSSTEDVWHILDVSPNSPADTAGLLPYGDYVIGSPEGLVKGESGLGELVEHFMSTSLRLYVYNHEYNVTRLVTIHPSRTWGGTGALGCVLGFGALHRIPPPLDEPPQGPGETLFETARLSTDTDNRPASSLSFRQGAPPRTGTPQLLVPAEMAFPPVNAAGSKPPPPPGTVPGRKARAHHTPNSRLDMDAYFEEGETKSRELDSGHSPKPGASSLAPPPKAGGPPVVGSPTIDTAASGTTE